MNIHQNSLTLFKSGIGASRDLLLGFPSNRDLLEHGFEHFNIFHRNKGYDGSKIVKFHPRQNFTFTIKAEYLVEELSDIGLISYNVYMMKPHNYKAKLTASATDTSGVIYTGEWILEGTLDRNSIVHTVIEFDSDRFIPKNFSGAFLPSVLKGDIEYELTNLLDDSHVSMSFDNNSNSSTGWRNIISRIEDKKHFEYLLEYYSKVDFVASTVTTEVEINRYDLDSYILEMWKYPDLESTLDIDYFFTGEVNGNLIEWGISIEFFKGMDFPYEYKLVLNNPWVGDVEFTEEDFYHNIDAGPTELVKSVPLTPYENQRYDPDIHGPNEIKTVSFNTNIAPSFKTLTPNYFLPGVNLYMVDENTNEMNYNHIFKKNIFGLTAIGGHLEREILTEYIYENRMFRVFKTRGKRNDKVRSRSARLHYEIIDLTTYDCVYKDIIWYSDESISGDDTANLSNDFYLKASNVFVNENKMTLLVERVVDYLKMYDANDVDNTIVKYEVIEVELELLTNKNVSTSLMYRDFTSEIPNLITRILSSYVSQGREKIYILPSIEATFNILGNQRIDILYKEIVSYKSAFDPDSPKNTFTDERFRMYYFRNDYPLTEIYNNTLWLPVADWGDTYGICGTDGTIFMYFQVYNHVTHETKYIGKEFLVADMSDHNINFEFEGFIKVLSYKDFYLIMNLKKNDLVLLKVDHSIPFDITLDENTISNNGLVQVIPYDIHNTPSFVGPPIPPQPSEARKDFKSWFDIDEVIKIMKYTFKNSSYISEDRFQYKYMNRDGSFVSTRSRGDILDFITSYNTSQIDFQDDTLMWFGVANTLDANNNNAAYTFRAELKLIGFENITNEAQVYNHAHLGVTELFEIYYKDNDDNQWKYTDKFYDAEDDIWFESFISGNQVIMFNREKDIVMTFFKNIQPIPRVDYISKLSYAHYSIVLPENGYLMNVNDYQDNSIMELNRTITNRIPMMNEFMQTWKTVPVKQRYNAQIFNITIYNFTGVINTIEARYGVDMPYDVGDLMPFTLKDHDAYLVGPKIAENALYVNLTNNVVQINGERVFRVIGNKLQDMKYFYQIEEEFVFFPFPFVFGTYSSDPYGPPESINGTVYNRPVPDSDFNVDYVRDYADGQDLSSILSYTLSGNAFHITNNLLPKVYNLRFDNNTKEDVSVNKRDVLSKTLDANLFERPFFKKFQWPYAPLLYTFVIGSSQPLVKAFGANNIIYYFTNHDVKTEEHPKLIKAEKLSGHSNTFLYWRDTPSSIAKIDGSSVETFSDNILCIEAVEENIIIESNKFSNYQDGSVNGVDDLGAQVDSMMLSNEDYVLNHLTLEGRKDYNVSIGFSGILSELPSNMVGSPVFSVIVNNSVVDYEFIKAFDDIGLDEKQTRQSNATIRFFSKYKTKLNLSEEALTEERTFGICSISNAEMSKEYVIPLDNPNFSTFYFRNGDIAANITEFVPKVKAESENITIVIDFKRTLETINPSATLTGKTDEELWKEIIASTTQAVIHLFVRATIVFPDQIKWSPKLNLGTFYLNNQEFFMLPDANEDIRVVASDELTFSTAPVPVTNSQIELVNEVTNTNYTRVYFLDEDNKFVIRNEETLKITGNNTLIASFRDIDERTVEISLEDNDVDFISDNLIKLKNPEEEETEVIVSYMIKNSFCANINSKKNRVDFNVHSIEEEARFKANYSSDNTLNTNINVNPLLTLNRGFVQI